MTKRVRSGKGKAMRGQRFRGFSERRGASGGRRARTASPDPERTHTRALVKSRRLIKIHPRQVLSYFKRTAGLGEEISSKLIEKCSRFVLHKSMDRFFQPRYLSDGMSFNALHSHGF